MLCDCGAQMQWRCTDNKTNIAKFKCPQCGKVVCDYDDYKPPIEEKREPKHYHYSNGRFIVQKKINGVRIYIGCYNDEEIAKAVVGKMEEYDWDKSKLLQVYDELGMKRINRSWVCA